MPAGIQQFTHERLLHRDTTMKPPRYYVAAIPAGWSVLDRESDRVQFTPTRKEARKLADVLNAKAARTVGDFDDQQPEAG